MMTMAMLRRFPLCRKKTDRPPGIVWAGLVLTVSGFCDKKAGFLNILIVERGSG